MSGNEAEEYYNELATFVFREKESEIEDSWRLYDEFSIHQLESKTETISGLVPLGKTANRHYDRQFVFERPLTDDEDNPDDLTTRFGIYPRQKVIVGATSGGTSLPVEAEVTFTDDQTIGLAPEPEQQFTSSELDSIFNNEDLEYHVVHLLNPEPYDRKSKAVKEVGEDRQANSLVLGRTEISDQSMQIDSLYAGNLNEQQQLAAGRALNSPELLCIHGPPGTGKTRTLVAIAKLAVARGDQVLACAHSNQAIDNLLVGGSSVEQPAAGSLHEFVHENDKIKMARAGGHTKNAVVRAYYDGVDTQGADIVGATTSAASQFDHNEFDLVIVDEATQADQPSTFIPLLRGDTVVLAGDHKQLPPYCSNETSREQEMHISLFEHFREIYGPDIFSRLSTQYRMNKEIATFPNSEFYNDSLAHGSENSHWQVSDLKPIVGYHIQGDEKETDETHSKYNIDEAEFVAKQVRLLQMENIDSEDIGVITPYSAQIGKIDRELRNEKIANPASIEINTIDSFQGSEKVAIIVSLVRSNDHDSSGFLEFPDEGNRRLNVAMTRAQKRLVLIGNFDTLGNVAAHRKPSESCADLYNRLQEFLEEMECFDRRN
ncbi:AAA domain-containing protein [Haloarcula sp. AONF1]